MDAKEFMALKERKEAGERNASRAAGVEDELLLQLRDQFECHSLEQAEGLAAELQSLDSQLEATYRDLVAQYQKEWPE